MILDIPSGQYFALSSIGTEIWSMLEKPCTLASLCERLLEEYDVEPGRCEAEVSALLDQLVGYGLVAFEERAAG